MSQKRNQALGPDAPQSFSAPGRVNLIGEHTDYTGGLVMPMAIPFSTVATIQPASDGQYHFESDAFEGTRTLDPKDRSGRAGNWSDYAVGVLRELQALGIEPPPFSLGLKGNVPQGAGLSSSASVEVATTLALLAHAGAQMEPKEIALLCQRAENKYVNSPCGIMDQFVVTLATAGFALLLNTRDLSYESLPMNGGALANCCVVVANSGVRHSIAGGDYGLRRRQLEAGQVVLSRKFPQRRDLGEMNIEELEACKADMPPESYKRCHHVISENARVREAGKAMLAGDPAWLGKTMIASHASQRDDFECSVEEVDFLVATAVQIPGCYGARLTGGGFGGCTVNLVSVDKADSFASQLRDAYRSRFQIEAEIYVCEPVDGAIAHRAKEADGADSGAA